MSSKETIPGPVVPSEIYFREPEMRHSLLRAEQEWALGQRIQAGISKENEEREISADNVVLTEDARDALKELVAHNLRLVVGIAGPYQGQGVDFGDLIQEGNMGLIDAGLGFDPSRGNRFSTYAEWSIKKRIRRAIASKRTGIGISPDRHYSISKILRHEGIVCQQKRKNNPSVGEIAASAGLSERYVSESLQMSRYPVYLDDCVGGEVNKQVERIELLGDRRPSISNMSEAAELPRRVRKAISEVLIDERLRFVLYYRNGLIDGITHTLDETGKKLGVCKERARQLEAMAHASIRASEYSSDLHLWLER